MGQSIAAANAAQMAAQCGRTVLWLGVETRTWQLRDWHNAATFARSLGVDSVCGKVADGAVRWYPNGLTGLTAIRDTVHAAGAGFIPFMYCYGPKFGMQQVNDESVILGELLHVCPVAQCDMEAEYNGQTAAAQRFCALARPMQGLLSISTWADPVQQAWEGVAHDLAPCVNQWVIQQYTDWLAAQEGEYDPAVFTCIAPGVDLRPEFGADHVLSIVDEALAHHHSTIYIWEYESAQANPQLVRDIVAKMGGHAAPPPVNTPTPAPAPSGSWVRVLPGNTLSGIAFAHHVTVAALLAANPFIKNPNYIQAGWTLRIP